MKLKKNKTILVTGGSKGIGRSICIDFLKNGENVVFTYRKKDNFSVSLENIQLTYGGSILGVRCDSEKMGDLIKLKKTFKRKFKNLDVLINNVGDAIQRSKFENSTDKLWQRTLNVNLISTIRTSKIFLDLLKKTKNSCIINIGSIAGKNPSSGDSLHYAVAKSALKNFTKGLAFELKNIRVNCIAPSIIETNFQTRLSSKKRLIRIIKTTPLKRIGKPDDVSNMVTFISSSKASYINGQIIYISGGRQ